MCTTARGQEFCADPSDVVVAVSEGVVEIGAEVDSFDAEIGYDRASIGVIAQTSGGAVEVTAAFVPIFVDCTIVAAHGDHCHTDTTIPMVCALEPEPSDLDVQVHHFDEEFLSITFEGRVDVDRPPCCENTCEWVIGPVADPGGPYRVSGAIAVEL